MQTQIKEIIVNEFTSLINNIESDFIKNYNKKNNNFLLSELDEEMTAHMVFVSSFESKSGNAIQECARQITILRYGEENVPKVVNLSGQSINEENFSNQFKEQVLVSSVNMENEELQGKIQSFMTLNQANGKGNNRIECKTNQQSIQTLLNGIEQYQDGNLHCKPVDLAFYDENKVLHLLEIKAGGDLDSSNAPGNARKMLTIYAGANHIDTKLYFATIYNKNGEGKNWSGIIKKYLAFPDMFLIGSEFWNKILPEEISFEDFKEIYHDALKSINLNARLRHMIQNSFK